MSNDEQGARQYCLDVPAPTDVSTVLRTVADRYNESAVELSAAWQDKNAGAVWSKIARVLERAADRIDKLIERAK